MGTDDGRSVADTTSPPLLKRPWWRWSLITLAAALFALLWSREIFDFSPGETWLLAGAVFIVWWLGPAPVAGNVPTWMGGRRGARPRRVGPSLSLAIAACRFLAVLAALAAVVSALQVFQAVVSFGRMGGFGPAFLAQLVSAVLGPLAQLAIASALWLLSVVAARVDGLSGDVRALRERLERDEGASSDGASVPDE